ncbi:MAG: Imm51 family immunity protein [Flavobacterium sp.]
MADYIKKIVTENPKTISVCFYTQQNDVIEMGKKIKKTVSNSFGKFIIRLLPNLAKMNGYDWEGFINYYLQKNHPEVLQNMETDPEAGMYVAYFTFSVENEKRADSLIEIITDLMENESKFLETIEKDGRLIKWNLD